MKKKFIICLPIIILVLISPITLSAKDLESSIPAIPDKLRKEILEPIKAQQIIEGANDSLDQKKAARGFVSESSKEIAEKMVLLGEQLYEISRNLDPFLDELREAKNLAKNSTHQSNITEALFNIEEIAIYLWWSGDISEMLIHLMPYEENYSEGMRQWTRDRLELLKKYIEESINAAILAMSSSQDMAFSQDKIKEVRDETRFGIATIKAIQDAIERFDDSSICSTTDDYNGIIHLGMKEAVDKIEKGKTTEDGIIALFGDPMVLLYRESLPWHDAGVFSYIKSKQYPFPQENQKIFGYEFEYTDKADPNYLSASGTIYSLLITINKNSGVVEDFKVFRTRWAS